MANVVLSFLLAIVSALESAVRCTFISFVSVTTPQMRKGGNPYFGRVQKRTTVKGALFNATYIGYDADGNELPKNERSKEPLPWGTWRIFRKTIDHKGKVYMRCYFLPTTKVVVNYLIDGRTATDAELEEIKTFLYKGGEDKADARGKTTRTYDLTNVVALHINKHDYRAEEYETAKAL